MNDPNLQIEATKLSTLAKSKYKCKKPIKSNSMIDFISELELFDCHDTFRDHKELL